MAKKKLTQIAKRNSENIKPKVDWEKIFDYFGNCKEDLEFFMTLSEQDQIKFYENINSEVSIYDELILNRR